MDPKLLKLGGWGALVYAASTAFFYAYLWWRWPMVERQEAEAVLKTVGRNTAWWQSFWWLGIILSFSLIPTFPALCQVLLRTEPAYAYIALLFGFIAIILGTLGPLRHATITPTLAELYTNTSDKGVKQAIVLIYKAQEAYGQGLFCLFGSTWLVGWVGLGGLAMLSSGSGPATPDFPQYLGWLGIVVGGLWIVNILSRILLPVHFLPGLVLFSFLLWVFLTGLRLLSLAGGGWSQVVEHLGYMNYE